MENRISKNQVGRDEYRRFLGRFFTFALVLFSAACFLPQSCYEPLARLTAVQTNALLQFAGLKSLVHGEHIFVKGISAWIVPECTPVYMILVFAAFVVSFPATVKERVEGMIAGALFLTAANVVRLGLTIALGAVKPVWFNYIHAYIGQVWSILPVLIACFVWGRRPQSPPTRTGILRFAGCLAVASAGLFMLWLPWNEVYVKAGDAILRRMFSWFDQQIFFSYGHSVHYHTFNIVVYGALIVADRVMDRPGKFRALILGISLLALIHLVLRFFNVLFSGYGWTAFLPVATTVHLTSQLVLPIVIWFTLGGGPSFRQTITPSKVVRKHPSPMGMSAVAAIIAIGVSVPAPAFARAKLLDGDAIYRELSAASAQETF